MALGLLLEGELLDVGGLELGGGFEADGVGVCVDIYGLLLDFGHGRGGS